MTMMNNFPSFTINNLKEILTLLVVNEYDVYFLSWQQSANADPFPSHAIHLTEDVPNPDALYSSLDMLTDDLPGTQNDSHSTNRG